jgi:hypothetical protein
MCNPNKGKQMKRAISVMVVAIALLVSVTDVRAQVDTADEVISKHIESIGGYAAIKSLQNLVYSNGMYIEGDFRSDGNSAMSVGRPYYKLVGDKNSPGQYMEGYDGAAWEWFADPGVVIRTVGRASEAIRHYAGVESPLFEYRKKGSTAEIVGETEFDENSVIVIRLTQGDGHVEQFYIDKRSYLVLATSREAPIHAFGEAVMKLTRNSDYRRVGGVLIAHAYQSVQLPSGDTLSTMQWGNIVANQALPEDWFSAPEFERTDIQRFIEQLYDQRGDLESVMWTYRNFRAAFPMVDTSEAVNMAGFQILKMGVTDTAIALLSQNVMDNPDSAAASFELGRAHHTAGNVPAAREEYTRTLALDPDHEPAQSALLTLPE